MSTFDPAACAELMEAMTAMSLAAADAIRRSRGQGSVRIKADGSPVTAADEAAEAVIRDGLAHLAPALPVISEEQAERAKPAIASASFILVDPLDGTREFIAGRDEYTINIAAGFRWRAHSRRHYRAGPWPDLARHRRPRRRAAGIFLGQDVAAARHPHAASPRG